MQSSCKTRNQVSPSSWPGAALEFLNRRDSGAAVRVRCQREVLRLLGSTLPATGNMALVHIKGGRLMETNIWESNATHPLGIESRDRSRKGKKYRGLLSRQC